MSELREEACAVGAVGGHLALLVVGEPGQGRGEIEDGLWQGTLQQEAHGTQTEGQHGQWGPGRRERADVTVPVPREGRPGPPLSPASPEPAGRVWWRGP
jgi:hypothetical protein